MLQIHPVLLSRIPGINLALLSVDLVNAAGFACVKGDQKLSPIQEKLDLRIIRLDYVISL